MKLKAAITGNLDNYLKAELLKAEKAVTNGIKAATTGLKNAMRNQVISSKLGTRLAKSWRGDVYPRREFSLNAAGVVYTKAEKIMKSFNYASVIRSRDGYWLAIPTPDAKLSKSTFAKRITPGQFERRKGIRLRFVYQKHGPSLLVAENRKASYSRKTGQLAGFRKASQSAINSGRGITSVVMFFLVPQVKMPKLIRFEPEATKWHNRLPALIVKHWKDAL